ncbi:MAG: alpha/beta hydrolase, partial [SAR116 cluster bacterium]|nr:alpha/beta hydrolase [SAR116 cluster bacterium]
MRTAEKVKNSEGIIFGCGHFPTSADPDKFKEGITPVLKKILQNDPGRRGDAAENWSSNRSSSGGGRPSDDTPQRRVIDL